MVCSTRKADIQPRGNPWRMRAPEGNSAYPVTHLCWRCGIDVERKEGGHLIWFCIVSYHRLQFFKEYGAFYWMSEADHLPNLLLNLSPATYPIRFMYFSYSSSLLCNGLTASWQQQQQTAEWTQATRSPTYPFCRTRREVGHKRWWLRCGCPFTSVTRATDSKRADCRDTWPRQKTVARLGSRLWSFHFNLPHGYAVQCVIN